MNRQCVEYKEFYRISKLALGGRIAVLKNSAAILLLNVRADFPLSPCQATDLTLLFRKISVNVGVNR